MRHDLLLIGTGLVQLDLSFEIISMFDYLLFIMILDLVSGDYTCPLNVIGLYF